MHDSEERRQDCDEAESVRQDRRCETGRVRHSVGHGHTPLMAPVFAPMHRVAQQRHGVHAQLHRSPRLGERPAEAIVLSQIAIQPSKSTDRIEITAVKCRASAEREAEFAKAAQHSQARPKREQRRGSVQLLRQCVEVDESISRGEGVCTAGYPFATKGLKESCIEKCLAVAENPMLMTRMWRHL